MPARKASILVSLLLLCGWIGPAAAQSWSKTLSLGGSARGLAVVATPDCGALIAGEGRADVWSELDVWVVKLDDRGAVEWQRTFGGSDDREDRAFGAVVAADGGFLVAGQASRYPPLDWDAWAIKLDATGQIQWQRTYGTSDASELAHAVDAAPDGGFVLAGYRQTTAAGRQMWVARLDPSGLVDWQNVYDSEPANAVRGTADGGFIVAGGPHPFASTGPMRVLRLDATGAIVWQKAIDYPAATSKAVATAVEPTTDGGFVVSGYGDPGGGAVREALVLKLASDGSIVWQQAYGEAGGTRESRALDIAPLSGGGFAVSGQFDPGGVTANNDILVMELDSVGSIVRQKRFGRDPETERAYSIAMLSDGGYLVGGDWDFELAAFKLRATAEVSSVCVTQGNATAVARVPGLAAVAGSALATPASAAAGTLSVVATDSAAGESLLCFAGPYEVSAADSSQPLRFLDRVTLEWEERTASLSDFFNLYRGALSALSSGDYGSCLQSTIFTNSATVSEDPPDGAGWFYLVAGESSFGEGHLGCNQADGQFRVSGTPCP